MRIDKIKDFVQNGLLDNKLETLIKMTELMESYRSIFIGSGASDLSSVQHDLLKSFMVQSLDFCSIRGTNKKFFCIPIELNRPIDNRLNIKLPKSGIELQDKFIRHWVNNPSIKEVSMGKYIVSRRTLFGGNLFNTFDTLRALTSEEQSGYLTDEVVLNESDDECLFYLVGMCGVEDEPFNCNSSFDSFIKTLSLSEYFPSQWLSVGRVTTIAEEYARSLVKDISIKAKDELVNNLGFTFGEDNSYLNLQTAELTIDNQYQSARLILHSIGAAPPILTIDIPRFPDVDKARRDGAMQALNDEFAAYGFRYFKICNVLEDSLEIKTIHLYSNEIQNKSLKLIS